MINPGTVILVVFFCTLIAVLGVAYFLYVFLFSERQMVERRFDSLGKAINHANFSELAIDEFKRKSVEGHEYFVHLPAFLNIPLMLEQAGVQTDAVQWVIKANIFAFIPPVATLLLTQNILWAGALWIVLLFFPYFSLLYKKKGRLAKFESQLPQALDIISRSLRAGHPLSVGLQMVSTELPDPISSEFSRLFYEEQMGIPIEESLRTLTKRVPIIDLNFLIVTILIHRQIGGDLSEIIDNLSKIVRERFRILGQVRSLTAEGRMSGWVLSLLPIIMFALMLIINPDYVSLLIKTEQGQKMLMASGAMMIIGILIIRKIVNIKV